MAKYLEKTGLARVVAWVKGELGKKQDAATAVTAAQVDSVVAGAVDPLKDGTTVLPYVKKSGDTMTGNLTLQDCGINFKYGTLWNGIMQYYDGASITRSWEYFPKPDDYEMGTQANKLLITGDTTLDGRLNLKGHALNYIAAPIYDTDAANKKYVDDQIGSVASVLDTINGEVV